MRAELLRKRAALDPALLRLYSGSVLHRLSEEFPQIRTGTVGFYRAFSGEIDLTPLMVELLSAGATAALPKVVAPGQPLEFHCWRPGEPLEQGAFGTMHPAALDPVQPQTLLAPLVGFDREGYRLGYGGGYYDRTLAAMAERPLTIGVGFESTRLNTIYPQAHDVPLDFIATERSVYARAAGKDSAES